MNQFNLLFDQPALNLPYRKELHFLCLGTNSESTDSQMGSFFAHAPWVQPVASNLISLRMVMKGIFGTCPSRILGCRAAHGGQKRHLHQKRWGLGTMQ